MSQDDTTPTAADESGRRSFLTRFGAAVVGFILVLFPFAAGLGVFLHPLRRRARLSDGDEALGAADFVRICPLDSLPADGVPHEFVVSKDVANAWTRTAAQRVGSVFLARTPGNGASQVRAFTATCPHLGCAVEFDGADERFECPCHESAFAKDGERLFGPSLRGLDPLEVKLVDDHETQMVWVNFQQFRTGIAERIPIG